MFSGMKNFLNRHKKKFLISGFVIGGAIFVTKFMKKKLIEWQEQEAKEFLEITRKEHHFRSTEKTCNQTICSLSKTLKETITKIIDTNDIIEKIRKNQGDKVHLWNTLKIEVFAQLFSLLYSGLMLVIVLRVQLNVIGGYMFREKMDSQSHDLFSSTFQEHYLSLCHYFLNKGVKDICTLMQIHSRLVLDNISLKQKMSLQDIEQVFWSIQSSLNNDPIDPLKNLSKYLLPPVFNTTINKDVDTIKMKQIIDETFEILDSDEVKSIADSCIKRAFSNVVDKMYSSFYSMIYPSTIAMNLTHFGTSSNSNNDDDDYLKTVTKVSMPVAKIIPIVHSIYNDDDSNDDNENDGLPSWIEQFLLMDNINLLGANLYEAFS
ncbi:hypothetical protein O3M35_003454 [Rhynocoris fuscipes]